MSSIDQITLIKNEINPAEFVARQRYDELMRIFEVQNHSRQVKRGIWYAKQRKLQKQQKKCIAKYRRVCYLEHMEEFYSPKQLAKILGVNVITVRRWIIKGILPAIYLGEKSKEYRVSKHDFEKFIQERRVKK